METDDYEYCDQPCPRCGHTPTHWRDCTAFCGEGFIDLHDDDPINYAPGEEIEPCPECLGTGIEHWCPKCSYNMSGGAHEDSKKELDHRGN